MKFVLKTTALFTLLNPINNREASISTNTTNQRHSYGLDQKQEQQYALNPNDPPIHIKIQAIKENVKIIQKQLVKFPFKLEIPKVFFMGTTGSGKSTLINYLLGNQMKIQKQSGGRSYHITPTHSNSIYPQIGNSRKSCTTVPGIYRNADQNIFYVDTAGFEDTSGVQIQIINSYALKELFRRGQQVKLAIIITQSSLFDKRGGQLFKIIKKVTQMFTQDIANLLRSIILVFNKVDLSEQNQKRSLFQKITDIIWDDSAIQKRLQITKNDIHSQVYQIIEENQEIDRENKLLIKKIIDRNQTIIVPKADHITKQIANQFIINFSRIIPYTLTKDAKISLGKQEINYLNLLEKQIVKQMKKCTQSIKKQIKLYFQKKTNIKQTKEQLTVIIDLLIKQKQIINQIFKGVLNQQQILDSFKFMFYSLEITSQLRQKVFEIIKQYKFCKILDQQMIKIQIELLNGILQTIQQQNRFFHQKRKLIITKQQQQKFKEQQQKRARNHDQSLIKLELEKMKMQHSLKMKQLENSFRAELQRIKANSKKDSSCSIM